jgi:hypothetical protein
MMPLFDINRVLPAVVGMLKAMPGAEPNIEYEIRDACDSGKALCFKCDDGMVVATLEPVFETGQFEFLVWVAVGWSGQRLFETYQPDMLKVAKELGAETMVFYSYRKGWSRKLVREWSKTDMGKGKTKYSRAVP